MYQIQCTLKKLLSTMQQTNKIVYDVVLRHAYEYAAQKHANQTRKSGEAYILHPLRVACLVASWGAESDMVVSALLHDIVEDCETPIEEIEELFGPTVAKIVDTLTAVNADLKNAGNMTKEDLDNISDARLIRKMNKKALLIKVADRLDNLNTISCFAIKKQIKKAQHTREILIPMVKKLGAYKLVDELEELCLTIEHPEKYSVISDCYNSIRKQNAFSSNMFLNMFHDTFNLHDSFLSQELIPYKSCISEFVYEPRSIVSIYRQLVHESKNLDKDLPKLLTKKHIALYNLTLVVKNEYTAQISSPRLVDIFFQFYEKIFAPKGVCMIGASKTTYKDSEYLILRDAMNNLYRLFIKSEKEYLAYKLGDNMDDSEDFAYMDVNSIDPRDAYNKKIKVFKKDGSAMFIDDGATVLDFAFAIHSSMGLRFSYALIDNSLTRMSAYTRLTEGDKVTIFPDEDGNITAKISWFRYIKTSKAVHHLVKYFEQTK